MKSIRQIKTAKRTCMGCRQVRPKFELIRLVNNSGKTEIDLNGNKPGRGAYLCKSIGCWRKALKGACLESALKIRVSQEDKDRLMEYSENLGM